MRRSFVVGFLLFTLAGAAVFALTVGPVSIPLHEIVRAFVSPSSAGGSGVNAKIILEVRLPRVLLALLVGGGLGAAGCAMQALFRNAMASPYTMGVSSGGAFGASLAILLGGTAAVVVSSSFLGCLITVILVLRFARAGSRVPLETLLLSGMALSLFFSALTSFVQYVAKEGQLREILFWLMGGLWAADWGKLSLCAPIILLAGSGLWLFHRELDLLTMGEEQALNAGVETEKVKVWVLTLASLVTAATVACCGMIGFVGLIIPHIARSFSGPAHRWLLPESFLLGALYLLLVDTFARTILGPTELPAGVITALIGVPFFLFVLQKRKRVGGF
jgi:iron complex transport system permease protein